MRAAALALVFLCLALVTALGEDCSWPGSDEHPLGEHLPDELEISGVAWSPVLQLVAAVGDEDALVVMETNGTVVDVFRNASRGFGLECVTFGPLSSQSLKRVYAAIEFPAAIVELDLTTGYALRLWNVTDFPNSKKYGMEALTFVPVNATTGWFYAGSQQTGKVYVVGPLTVDTAEEAAPRSEGDAPLSLPIVASFGTGLDLDDLAALSYDAVHGHMWALFDRYNVAATLRNTTAITIDPSSTANWTLECKYDSVPGEGQEGICTAGVHGQYILLGQDRSDRTMQLVRFDYDSTR